MDDGLRREPLAWMIARFKTTFADSPTPQLWQMRTEGGRTLIDRMRNRYACQLAAEGGQPSDATGIFDENVLTLGFARRFATYKRPDLLLHDPERLVRLLSNPRCPVQLILAGKAHPGTCPDKHSSSNGMTSSSVPGCRDVWSSSTTTT